MIQVKLRSTEFFVQDGAHQFNFEASAGSISFHIPVIVANEGSIGAIHNRAFENLEEIAKQIGQWAKANQN
jgi:hypothetical protein